MTGPGTERTEGRGLGVRAGALEGLSPGRAPHPESVGSATKVVHVFFLKILGIQLWGAGTGVRGSSSVLRTRSDPPAPQREIRESGTPAFIVSRTPGTPPHPQPPPFYPSPGTQESWPPATPLLCLTRESRSQAPSSLRARRPGPGSLSPRARVRRCTCSFSAPTMPAATAT